jgi:predicted O-linked N-acetylglucosamine transferase (SPINDLY family)
MSWLRRVLGARADAPQPRNEGDELLRRGFEREAQRDLAGAAELYGAIEEGDPAHAAAMFYLARLAVNEHRLEEAIGLFQRAADESRDDALFRLALGDAFVRALRFDEARAAYDACRSLQREPTVVSSNYAGALAMLNRREEARVELERLLEITPYASEVHFNLGGIYREYCRTEDAIAAYTRALELNPESAETYSNLLLQLNMSASLSPEAIYAEHRRFGEHVARRYSPPEPDRTWPRRQRIGYLSADFRRHVVSFFLEPILANHDHERFEVACYHTHAEKDSVTEELRALADRWVDCEQLSDAEIAERVRADGVDILVDLGGHTAYNRLLVMTRKPAPVQATYLGYPNTTGLTTVDYRITDAIADPPGDSDRLSSERLVRLPNSYFCFRPGEDAPAVGPLPAAASGMITFGCFNHFAKISDAFLATVARVLEAVPKSRFLLKGRPLSIPEVAAGVRRHFERLGIDPGRVDVRGWESTPLGHLAIYGQVDIALDSFPYSGATTTCEALWMGAPIVSLAGDRHAGRMCSSILTTVGLGEWIARDREEYVAKCVAMSSDLGRLAEMRRTMRDRMRATPLMDEKRFARDLERLYVEMWQRTVLAAPAAAGDAPAPLDATVEEARAAKAAGKPSEALQLCRNVLEQAPEHRAALEILWDSSFDAGSPGSAIDPLVRAIRIREDARLQYMLGCALEAQGKALDAVASFRRAIELEPGFAKAHNNLGCALEAAGSLEEAAGSYAAAAGLDGALAQARYNLGSLLHRLGRGAEAIEHIRAALALEPGNSAWRCRLGELEQEASRLDEALENFHAAVEADPSDARAQTGLGHALLAAGRVDDSLAALRRALELEPTNAALESLLVSIGHFRAGHDRRSLYQMQREWAKHHARGLVQFSTGAPRRPAPGRRINVGYLATDFLDPRVAPWLEAVLAAHDRSVFDVYCYAAARMDEAAARRLQGLHCEPRDISSFTDLQAIDRIRVDSIDVLIDVSGHAAGARPLVVARRPAAVQLGWLGDPPITGLLALDYRITDAVSDPPGEADRSYSEALIRLASGAFCYTPPADAPDIAPLSELPASHAVFASYNELASMGPDVIALWARILHALPAARIRLQAAGFGAESARRRLFELFATHGIAADRIDARRPDDTRARRLAAYHDVDVALDVFPWNGRNAICESLWMGVPVVTLAGQSSVARAGASILCAAGMEQCVAGSAEEYVETVLSLARDVTGRRALRRDLRPRLRASRLLDGRRFARELEAALREAIDGRSRK